VPASQPPAQDAHNPDEPAVVVDESVTWPAQLPPALARELVADWQPRPPDERDVRLAQLLLGDRDDQESNRGQ
jgi:hypothetical protein